MERDAERFYRQAATRSTDAAVRRLLGDIAEDEAGHERRAVASEAERLPGEARDREDEDARKRFVLQVIQPGLVALMGHHLIINMWAASRTVLTGLIAFCLAAGIGPDGGEMA